jgi:hypothetical protein
MIGLRISETDLELVVIFRQHGKILSSSVHPIETPEAFREAMAIAYDAFHSKNPDVSLLDDVEVIFDKVD